VNEIDKEAQILNHLILCGLSPISDNIKSPAVAYEDAEGIYIGILLERITIYMR
jgi:hypothetical protein